MDKRCIVGESDGGAPMITRLCEEQWDHIFFTGSVSVGKIIYQVRSTPKYPLLKFLKIMSTIENNSNITFKGSS